MDSALWSQIISDSVVPVVIISACGLLCLTFYNRLAFVVGRLRNLQRERLNEYKELDRLKNESGDSVSVRNTKYFLEELEEQTLQVMKRASLLRNCLFCLLGTIASLVFCSLCIGLNIYFQALGFLIIFFFIAGLFLLLYALAFAFLEMKRSLYPVQLESQFIQKLLNKEDSSGSR